MQFDLTIEFNSTIYRFKVEQSKPLKGFERFTLTGGDRIVILQSNRPMLLARGLKKKPITWKLLEGEVKSDRALEMVIKAIEGKLKQMTAGTPPKMPKQQSAPTSRYSLAKTSRQKHKEDQPPIPWSERIRKEPKGD